MTSIKLKFRTHTNNNKRGVLYFQIIHNRVVKQVKTDYCIYVSEWQNGGIVSSSPISESRNHTLKVIRNKIAWELSKLEQVVKSFENEDKSYITDEVVKRYKTAELDKISVFEYMRQQSERLKKLGRLRTSETYRQTLNSFMRFRNGANLYFDMLDTDVIEQYECYMRANSLSRNTTSFYMRILRCIYNRAVEEGLTSQTNPFKRVYTGVDKTAKRAITLKEIV